MTEAPAAPVRLAAVMVGAIVLGSLSLMARSAAAEPHFSIRTGLDCSRCHISPTGGGMRTPYGALYGMSSLSVLGGGPRAAPPSVRWAPAAPAPGSEAAGPGAAAPGAPPTPDTWDPASLATGVVTQWLAVGADVRVANRTTFTDDIANTFDASAANLYVALHPWPGRVTLYVDEQVGAGGAQNRALWAMVHGPWSTYLRAGRLFPPFGLRILDDEAYIRRATGATFQNPDLGVELGWIRGPLFAAVAVTNGSFSGADIDAHKAVFGQLSLQLGAGRLGLSGGHNPSEAGCRSLAAIHGGVRLGRLALLGEADLITDRLADRPRRVYQLAAYAEADFQLLKGLSLRAGWDYHDADLELSQDRRQRFRVGLDLFPLRMVEVKLYYVSYQAETVLPLDRADRLEVVLHGYL